MEESKKIIEICGNSITIKLEDDVKFCVSEEHGHKNGSHWVRLFEDSISMGKSLVFRLPYGDDSELMHRGTGKTDALLDIYKKYGNCSFLSKKSNRCRSNLIYNGKVDPSFNGYERLMIQKSRAYYGDMSLEFCSIDMVALAEYKNKIILIDELFTITDTQLEELKENHIVIGFVPLYLRK